jgi:hypothetical protein
LDEAAVQVSASVNRIAIDPRTAGDLVRTPLVAATDAGVYVSRDSGQSWQGDVVAGQGVFYTRDNAPTYGWQNLNLNGNTQLPSPSNVSFDEIMIDLCQQTRVYAWHMKQGAPVGLYTTNSALAAWTQPVTANQLPSYQRRAAPREAYLGATCSGPTPFEAVIDGVPESFRRARVCHAREISPRCPFLDGGLHVADGGCATLGDRGTASARNRKGGDDEAGLRRVAERSVGH